MHGQILTQYSRISSHSMGACIVFLQHMLKEKLQFFLINILLLPIPLLALTDGGNDRWRNKYTRCAWAGGTFFQLCCCVSILVSGGKQVLLLLTSVSRVQCSCGIVLVFWFWREIVFGITNKLSVQYTCAVVSVIWLWQEIVLWREIVLKMRTPFDFL